MMKFERDELSAKIRLIASEQFTRSGGPGGQNVNKVNTRVTLRVPLNELGLSEDEQQRLIDNLSNRVNAEGELVIHSTETRSQSINRELAVERAAGIISNSLKPVRRRKPTKPSRASRRRRLDAKRRRSNHKQYRRPPSTEED